MQRTLALSQVNLANLGIVRDLLELLNRIRQIQNPITSPDGLRQALELLLRTAKLLGVSGEMIGRLRQILTDDNVFQIVLAIVRLLSGIATVEARSDGLVAYHTDDREAAIAMAEFVDWLRVVVEIVNLIRMILGELPTTTQ